MSVLSRACVIESWIAFCLPPLGLFFLVIEFYKALVAIRASCANFCLFSSFILFISFISKTSYLSKFEGLEFHFMITAEVYAASFIKRKKPLRPWCLQGVNRVTPLILPAAVELSGAFWCSGSQQDGFSPPGHPVGTVLQLSSPVLVNLQHPTL